jgi:hypothetical protein
VRKNHWFRRQHLGQEWPPGLGRPHWDCHHRGRSLTLDPRQEAPDKIERRVRPRSFLPVILLESIHQSCLRIRAPRAIPRELSVEPRRERVQRERSPALFQSPELASVEHPVGAIPLHARQLIRAHVQLARDVGRKDRRLGRQSPLPERTNQRRQRWIPAALMVDVGHGHRVVRADLDHRALELAREGLHSQNRRLELSAIAGCA